MTPVTSAGAAERGAARLLLARLCVSAADLLAAPPTRRAVPTSPEYALVVAGAVGEGTCRVCGSSWKRVVERWVRSKLITVGSRRGCGRCAD